MFVIGMAYRGTANNGMIQKLLHFAVSDVSDDVRRAAVLNLGFLLLGVPDQCPPIVVLLSESYNAHVRYGGPPVLLIYIHAVPCRLTLLFETVRLLVWHSHSSEG